MPTYTIDGKRYTSDTPLSDAELEELSGGAPAGDYRAEAARKGLAGTAGTTAGVGRVISDLLTSANINPITLASRTAGLPAEAPSVSILESFRKGRSAVYDPLMSLFGSTGAQPQTGGERLVAGGIEAATSPESYLFPPLAGIRRMGPAAQALLRPSEQAVVGAGAEGGGQAGEYAGGKFGYPGTGRFVGSLVGGAGTAYGTGTALKTGALVNKAVDYAKNKVGVLTGVEPKDELLRDVNSRINNIFIAAGAADPNFIDTLEKAVKAQQSVSLKAPGAPAVEMPLSSLLANNPVINNFIQNLSSRDPVFRAQYGAQFEQAKQALAQNQIRLFGDPTKVKLEVTPINLAKVQERKLRSLDEQIADAYNKQEVDPNVFGQRVSTLLAKKEEDARKTTSPLYTEAFTIAKDKGVTLPEAAVDDIYNYVVASKDADVFRTFKPIFNKVERVFKPSVTPPSSILTAGGKPMTEGGARFSAATVEDLDSLKREINSALRKTNTDSEIRLLSDLKSRVASHIDSLDPDFVTAYKNADKAYLEKVGLPFNSATLKNVDRKKFVEQIAPAIIGNKSNVLDFVNATGEEGVKVVRDAFYDSFSKAALKNDVIDPKAANKWLAKNSSAMSLVPGLTDELRGSVNNVQALLAKRNTLNSEFERVAGEQIVRKEGLTNPQELVNRMYGDVKFTNKFMSQYGADKDAVNAARSFMLQDIVNSGDPVALLTDRNKAAVFNRVFGPTYAQKVADFATVSNRLQKDLTDVSFRGETVPKTPIEQLTGVPPEQIISRIYNPVSGPVYAMTSLFSKYWANAAAKGTEEKLKALLLNPNDALKVFQAVESQTKKFDPKKIEDAVAIGKKYGIQWINDAVNDLQSGAARGAIQGMEQ